MKILICGDFCPRGRVETLLNQGDYDAVLKEVREVTTGVDYSIVNLECPVAGKSDKLIDKVGPNLHCSDKCVEALKWAGFDAVTLANNHFLDFGEAGVKHTLAACRNYGLDTVGGGLNLGDAAKILFKDIKGNRLAIVNCCEHEFSIATDHSAGSNPLDVIGQYYAIQEAKKHADYVVVIVHGGVEHFWLPTERMKETYRFFVDAGADAVINHHQHCYSGYETYKEKPVFYGLGNFCFDGDQQNERWTSGYMVLLDIDNEKGVEYQLIPYRQCAEEPSIRLMQASEKDDFFMRIKSYNEVIADRKANRAVYEQWCAEHEDMYKSALNPLYNRITARLFDGSMGKRLIGKQKWLYTQDMLVNESHIERVRLLIDKQINSKK